MRETFQTTTYKYRDLNLLKHASLAEKIIPFMLSWLVIWGIKRATISAI